jgi:hypothetical protein
MGCQSSKELKNKVIELENKFNDYVNKKDLEILKTDIKNICSTGLEMSIPLIQNMLLTNNKNKANDLTKSYVTNTFHHITNKIDDLNNNVSNVTGKIEELETKKLNKPIKIKVVNDDSINNIV